MWNAINNTDLDIKYFTAIAFGRNFFIKRKYRILVTPVNIIAQVVDNVRRELSHIKLYNIWPRPSSILLRNQLTYGDHTFRLSYPCTVIPSSGISGDSKAS